MLTEQNTSVVFLPDRGEQYECFWQLQKSCFEIDARNGRRTDDPDIGCPGQRERAVQLLRKIRRRGRDNLPRTTIEVLDHRVMLAVGSWVFEVTACVQVRRRDLRYASQNVQVSSILTLVRAGNNLPSSSIPTFDESNDPLSIAVANPTYRSYIGW